MPPITAAVVGVLLFLSASQRSKTLRAIRPFFICPTVPILFLLDHLKSIVQSENIIVDIVGSWTVADELEEFTKMKWISSINLNGSRNEDD
jgi:hypothetical protein